MKTSIGPENRESVMNELGKYYRWICLIYKTRNTHWYIEGPDFLISINFWGTIWRIRWYNWLVAERIRSLGHYVDAMLKALLSVNLSKKQKNDSQL
jgi:starvation-inducible DNA-binding protein